MSETVDLTEAPSTTEPPLGSPWEDLRAYIALPRATSLALSPDGSRLLLGVQTLDAKKTAYTTALWQLGTRPGTAPRRLTRGDEGEQASCFLRDGSVVFTAKRSLPAAREEGDGEKDSALWCLPAGGGEAHVLARRLGGWGTVRAAREADRLVCALGLRAGLDSLEDDQAWRHNREEKGVHAILHEGAGVRFWDHDLPSDTTRLLVAEVQTKPEPAVRREDLRLATPDLGRALDDEIAISSDGGFAVAGWNTRLSGGETRSSLVRIDLATGEHADLASDEHDSFEEPVLSRDDRLLACVRYVPSDPTAAPHVYLHLVDLVSGERRDLASEWPRWGSPIGFSPDNRTLYVSADEDGEAPVFAVDVATGEVRRLTGHGAFSHVQVAPDGGALYALRSSWDVPGEVVRIDAVSGEVTVLDAPLSYPALPGRLERVEAQADDGARVPGWLLLPADASAAAPAPLALWVHGGPLNSWNAWSWRWCPWLLVSQGYAVLLPDPALSTGYGRDFVQRGWGAWGQSPYTDLMAITDAIERRDDVDSSRTVAMGGSFGGYMANWIAGHTDRFRCIVSHASLWNLESFGPTTDAPWYWGREMSPTMMAENSPHRFAERISTPMLVVHGDRDYRVPIGEGLALWWSLVQNFDGEPDDLPHRFLYFPDENHWVLQPQHAVVWYETVRGFLETHVNGAEPTRSEVL